MKDRIQNISLIMANIIAASPNNDVRAERSIGRRTRKAPFDSKLIETKMKPELSDNQNAQIIVSDRMYADYFYKYEKEF